MRSNINNIYAKHEHFQSVDKYSFKSVDKYSFK